MRQSDMFSPETSRLVVSMLTRDGDRLASRPRIEAGLRSYAEEALKNTAGARLFGEAAPVGDVLRAAGERASRETAEPAVAVSAPVFSDMPPPRQATADRATGERLRAAGAATKDRVQRFDEGPIGKVLEPGPRAGELATPASAVPAAIFRNGPAGYDSVKAYFRAAGRSPETIAAVEHGASSLLREKAISGDGTVRPAGLDEFKTRYGHALRAVDEVSPGFSTRFDDAGAATQAMMDATRNRLAEARAFKGRAAAKLLGVSGDGEVVRRVGRMVTASDGPTQVRDLMDATADSPEANAGARAAVGRWFAEAVAGDLKDSATGERELRGQHFTRLLREHRTAMAEALTPQQMATAGRIAETFDQRQRSNIAARAEGMEGARRKADRFFGAKGGETHSPGGLLFVATEGAAAGFERGGIKGAVGGLVPAAAGALYRAVRDAGLSDVRSIVNDALMNPDRMRLLLARLPKAGSRTDKLAASTFRRLDAEVPRHDQCAG